MKVQFLISHIDFVSNQLEKMNHGHEVTFYPQPTCFIILILCQIQKNPKLNYKF
jgi:hypothetical protein